MVYLVNNKSNNNNNNNDDDDDYDDRNNNLFLYSTYLWSIYVLYKLRQLYINS